MSLEEACGHQNIIDNGHHVLFKEKWERCSKCTYNLQENRKCDDYSKTFRYVPEIITNLIFSVLQNTDNQDIRS